MLQSKSKDPVDVEQARSCLKPDGAISKVVTDFESRPQQLEMLELVSAAYNEKKVALIEAGTGTGKSLAYLLPALLAAVRSGEKTLVATRTIHLQEQLLFKDLPQLFKALGLSLKVSLVKGMSNYLCLRRLEESAEEWGYLTEKERSELENIAAWSQTTKEGSKNSLPILPPSSIWERVQAEYDTCSGKKCSHYENCFYIKARKEAESASLLIANHHLLCLDLAHRKENDNYAENALLPFYHHVILDEAHHLEDVAGQFLGRQLSRIEVMKLMGRLSSDRQGNFGKIPQLKEKVFSLLKEAPQERVKDFTLLFNEFLAHSRRAALEAIKEFFDALDLFLKTSKGSKLRILPAHRELPIWKESIHIKAQGLSTVLQEYANHIRQLMRLVKDEKENQKAGQKLGQTWEGLDLFDLESYRKKLESYAQFIVDFMKGGELVFWIESRQRGHEFNNIHLFIATLDIASEMAQTLFTHFSSITLCSATLCTHNGFTFMRKRLGILDSLLAGRQVLEGVFSSPFNYAQQALLVVPTDLPSPKEESFMEKASHYLVSLLRICRGNAFVLFTSHAMLKECFEKVSPLLHQMGLKPFMQGQAPRKQLLDSFRQTEGGVLFGADSFWEGVDVAGDALRCVFLMKLPFQVPDDPLVEARYEAITKEGGSAFFEEAIPKAIVQFKQGFGRLIRKASDRGCIVCFDNRLINARYGALFLKSLPPCRSLFAPQEQIERQMSNFYWGNGA